jgi:hypothetical protein
MPRIPNDIAERLHKIAKITDVVGDFLKLRKTGIRYTALCPFHEDRHDGNFIVYPKDNCYKCFTCGAKGGPVQFLMDYGKMSYPDALRWLGKKYNIETDNVPFDYFPPPLPPPPPSLPMLILPERMVTSHTNTTDNILCKYIRALPWNATQRDRVEKVLAEYYVGHSKYGHTIFWQIDEQQRVHTGKMMLYKPDGHRDKESRYNFDWIHSILFRDNRFPQWSDDKQECQPCIFGLHLLNRYPHAAVNIVESEKTAILMAIAYGNHGTQIWMACGGAENLSREKLEPIIKQHRRIIIYPDRDAIDRWRAKQANLRYDRMSNNVTAVTEWWKPEDGDKADIADVVIRMLKTGTMPVISIGEIAKDNPAIKTLIDRFNLTEVNEE